MPKRVLQGVVVSDKQDKTVVVKVERRFTHPVMKKTVRRTKNYHAHDEANAAKVGDIVVAGTEFARVRALINDMGVPLGGWAKTYRRHTCNPRAVGAIGAKTIGAHLGIQPCLQKPRQNALHIPIIFRKDPRREELRTMQRFTRIGQMRAHGNRRL